MFVFDFLRLASVEVFEGDALKTTTLLETIWKMSPSVVTFHFSVASF